MGNYRIIAIVEGHGEQTAVPLLLRRWFEHRRFKNFETPELAVRVPASSLKSGYDAERKRGIEYYIERIAYERPSGILVLLDADDECIERKSTGRQGLGPELQERAQRVAPHIPVRVVVADREYEAWFLAALPQVQRHLERTSRLERSSKLLPVPPRIESIRDCKKHLSQALGFRYEETTDQHDLTESLPFTRTMAQRSRSYRRLLEALEYLTRAARETRRPARR